MKKISRREALKSGAVGLTYLCMLNKDFAARGWGPDELAAEFVHPPDSARPWVYWYFMDGYLTRDGMTADLKSMKSAGIGGAIYLEVDLGIKRGPVKFMSSSWQELLGHAFSEADRLGLQMEMAAGPGWCGAGGPWVTQEQSMQHLVASETRVTGPTRFDGELPRPSPRIPFFGEASLTPELHKTWKDFYLDALVLAFPTPSGNARIADIDEKALYTRGSYSSQLPGPYSSRPWVRPFLPSATEGSAVRVEECVAPSRVLDLTDRLALDGRLLWDVPSGDWTILRFGRTLTGQTNREAPELGLGWETDKFSQPAIDAHFDAYIASLLKKTGQPKHRGRGLTMLHYDSWEMSSQNWSSKFGEEFTRRRRYDPVRFLPAFSGYIVDSSEVSERFLWDVRQTAQELVVQNQILRLQELGQRHGLLLSIEPYDLDPCADLKLGSTADVPMGEFWSEGWHVGAGWDIKTAFSIVEATSLGHTLGRRVIGGEAFTALPEERWHQYPGSMKAQGDWALCAGVNRFVIHRYQSQPWMDRFPGMTMGPGAGFGVHWERTQTWWDLVPAYHLYLSRCQQMLRRGQFVADILYLAAEGAPNVFLPPPSAFVPGELADRRGYNFDGCDPEVLITRAAVKNGSIVFPDGMTYRLLVLPQVETMTPRLLTKIMELVEDGATVIGAPPQKSPSLVDYPKCDHEVREYAAKLWGKDNVTAVHRVGKGSVIYNAEAMNMSAIDPLARSKWIWSSVVSSTVIQSDERYFSRGFEVENSRLIDSAEIAITATSKFEIYVNGDLAEYESVYHLQKIKRVDVTELLISGKNLLLVRVLDGKDASTPSGLIGALTIKFHDGSSMVESTGHSWSGSLKYPGSQTHVVELGDFDSPPWNLKMSDLQERTIYPSYRVTADVLMRMGIVPDFEGEGIRYIHRRDGAEDLYFIANRENRARTTTCHFRIAGLQPEWWNPMTGERRDLPQFCEKDGSTSIPISLDAYESGFVIFRDPAVKTATVSQNFPKLKTVVTLTGPWQVSFDPNWGGPKQIVFSNLEDWSKRPEPGIRYYSGKAIYQKRFDCVVHALRSRCFISLGQVKNLASIKLNGHDIGVAWCNPWRVSVPDGVLQERNNRLEITVANLWINRLIGDSGLPQEKRLTWVPVNPFHPNSQLQESGLLGPVTVQKMLEKSID